MTALLRSALDLKDIVLVGAGHAHVQVLRSFAMESAPGARLTLIVDTPIAVYSGMVPGVAAGQYRAEEIEIDAVPLARRAGARVILAPALGLDRQNQRVLLEGRPAIPYDIAAVDIGSTVLGLDLPGVRQHAIATRPIGRLVARLAEVEARARQTPHPFRLLVVGGGAGGVELVATLAERLRHAAPAGVEATLVHKSAQLLPGYPPGLVKKVAAALTARGIHLLAGKTIEAVEPHRAQINDGSALPFDALFWTTGAAPHATFDWGGLATDHRGFASTRATLQVVGDDRIFATGDCATMVDFPKTPKAGVYAVRQGPYLIRNLRALLAGEPLEAYRPQSDFLTLLNLGDGTAIGGKWGFSFAGERVMRLKDWIDRRFMDRFQMLALDGAPGPAQETMPKMEAMEMICGGCAAKLSQEGLSRTLAELPPSPAAPEVILGLAEADDVAAVRLPSGEVLVMTVDFFRAFTDDPYLVGRVAALNALSDLEAKGVAPQWALALVSVPLAASDRDAEHTLAQVLAGARRTFDELGVRLLGGHTSKAEELQVGFSVQGVAASGEALLATRGAVAPGQKLILTRPLGTGVLFHADMAGRARGPWAEAALRAVEHGNRGAAALAREAGATAATDVTGFGFAGHLASMLAGAGLSSRIELARLPALPGAVELLARGERSTFHEDNARLRKVITVEPAARRNPRLDLLFDPQTAGGLLLAVPAEAAAGLVATLHTHGYPHAAVVGEILPPRPDGAVAEVVGG